ncbi:MAG TPA: TonB-dependent receptor [Caulobacteraceae bacterium]|nr:TonB-dependent receptor [Caulobacteraceae bacterium]
MRIKLGALALMSSVSILTLRSNAVAAEETAAAAATDSSVGEVVVTAPRQEDKARAVQLTAPNLIAVQSAETIQKYPDFNAAEALGRMPGLSLSGDTGEGRFVQIRGIDANLDGATYGGVPLLNTNPGGTASGGGGRAVEYDTIPTGAIDGIIVTYTLLPDHEAEGLGGSIELTPRKATNVTKPFLDATLGWGYEPLHDHTGPFEADVALGARFGFDDKGLVIQNGEEAPSPPRAGFISNPTPFSFVLTYSRKDDRRAVDDLEESYRGDPAADIVRQYDLRYYDYHRRRFSYGGELDFQPNDDHTYYLRADVAGYTEAQKKNFLLFTGISVAGVDPNDANGFIGTTNPAITLTDEEEVHRNTVVALGGEDHWGGVVLDYHGAYSRATFHVRRNLNAEFLGPTVPFTYDPVSTPPYPIFGAPGTNLNDAAMYALSNVNNNHTYDVDEEYSGAVNLTVPLHLLNDSDRIKVGGEVRLRDKSTVELDDQIAAPPPLSLTGFSGPAIAPYYNGHYTNGPVINRYAVRALLGTLDQGAVFNPTAYQQDTENIYAGYAQYTTTVGKWGLLAGVRVEDTEANYGAYESVTDAAGNTTQSFVAHPASYLNAFPTVQIRYDFRPDLVARFTYSTGIGRPGFNQNTTAATVDQSQNTITRGNPNLRPTTGDNFDLSLEYYLPNAGIVQVALFDKEFSNYIVPRILNGVNDPLFVNGLPGTITTFSNVSSAYARGVTVAYHQKFTWLPHPLQGLGIEGNFTYVDSRILEYDAATSVTGQNEYGLLPGTSPITWNLAAFYEAYGINVRLSGEYISHSLFGLGGDKTLDTIQDSRFLLDLSSSYEINNTWTVYFNAKNLTNQPLRYYEGYVNRPIQREFYDITLEGGVRAHF